MDDFETFFRAVYPKAVAALQAMGYGAEAEDSANEAMIRLITSSRPVEFPRAWVMKVAFRTAAKNRAQREMEGDVVRSARRELLRDEPPADQLDQLDQLWLDLLNQLAPARRQVIALYYHGFQTYEIAEVLGAKEATIRSHRRHAKKQLSELIAGLQAELRAEFDEFIRLLKAEGVPGHDQ